MKASKFCISILLFLGLTSFFTVNFTKNVFNLGVPHVAGQWHPNDFVAFEGVSGSSEQAIAVMLETTKHDGLFSTGGFMAMEPKKPYMSAWGLHGKILSCCFFLSKDPVLVFITKAQTAVALIFGVLLALFIVFIFHELGWGAALALAIGLNWSDWLVFVARNTYHVYFMHLLPLVLAWVLYPCFQHPQGFKWRGYLMIIGGAVLANALCIPDYGSNIALSVATAPIYYGFRDDLPISRIIKGAFAVVMASAAAVALAILATGVQASFWLGSMTDGFGQLFAAYSSRMYSTADMAKGAPVSMSVFSIFEQYLTIPALTLPWLSKVTYHVYLSFFAFIIIGLPACLFSFLDGRRFPCIEKERNKLIGLSVATVWGLLATLSWAFLMKGHMSHHYHINGMIFYLPYMLLLYMFLGKIAAVTVRQVVAFTGTHQQAPLDATRTGATSNGKDKRKKT